MKRILWVLFVLLGIVLIAGFFFIKTLKPDYDGELELESLQQEVSVYYDSYGIPHIYGSSEKDAFRALGYIHAQDRLWQMELLRRIGKGQLSELFGKDLISTDKFFLALGIDDASAKTVSQLNKNDEGVQLTQAYLDGINSFLKEGPTPVEFYLTGIEKRPFELTDVYNVMGYMAFSFAMAHKTDPLLTKMKEQLGPQYLKDLSIHSDTSTVWLKNTLQSDSVSLKTNEVIAGIFKTLEALNIPQFEGSNSWVLGPEKTKNKKVIFANDPHIGFSQPSVWYEAHVVTPQYEKYGYHLAGVPFPILGHDRNLAYGMTMFENDDVDFYYEDENPEDKSRYRVNDSWRSYEMVDKIIKVKDSTDIEFTFKKTHRGPILNGIADQVDMKRPVSMWWVYTQHDNQVMKALYELSHANDIDQFRASLKYIHAPGLNIMYGDAKDNVAWWASAHLYQIPDSVNTKLIYDGTNYLDDQKKYLDFSQNPHAENPDWHYVYSANNQPDSIAGMLYPGYYLPENRARRIVDLLDAKDDWVMSDVQKMINDVNSPVDVATVKSLLKLIDMEGLSESDLGTLDDLGAWQGGYELDDLEATVFHRWMFYVLNDVFKDELGQGLFDEFMSTHLIKRSIAPLVNNENSVWWNDVATEKEETAKEIVTQAFHQAISDLEKSLGSDREKWFWQRVHTLEHGHPIGQVEMLRSFFNVGPFEVEGSREVINNMYFPYGEDGNYKVSSGPSTRRVIDFSDIENSMSILPTGQSGNPFSEHYKDQAQMYAEGKFRKMMMNKKEIQDQAESVLKFLPSNKN
ncbi:penicillin acylase family protein [Euzebyella marina]|uniref:Penicillin acylase family protein n=1 Tax=Euzebyella marina TaxID=1761453 RepID=A0A3G2L7J0_9FLAO|nr:penicillin acylase family protein [Euzebyella marina]AYN68205.1 penicillin acylase family protein [Euzebyella marina]